MSRNNELSMVSLVQNCYSVYEIKIQTYSLIDYFDTKNQKHSNVASPTLCQKTLLWLKSRFY